MKDRKIIKILTNFNLKERKAFFRYVSSPYFNTNQKIADLLSYIYRFSPDYEDKNFTIEKAFQQLFKKEPFNERIITRLISKLFKLAEDFICTSKNEKDSFTRNIYLLEYYYNNQMTAFFDPVHKKLNADNEASTIKDDNYYYKKYLTEFHYIRLITRDDRRDTPINLNKLISALDAQYWIRKLSLLSAKVNHQILVKHQVIDNSETEYVLQYLKNHDLQKIPAVQISYCALELLNDPTVASYPRFKEILSEHHTSFPVVQVQNFYNILINSIPNCFSGVNERLEEYFRIFSEQIDLGYIYSNGYILPQALKNVMTVALRLKKYKWAASFLESNKEKILSREVYFWNLSALLYEKGDYEKSLELLMETKYNDTFYLLSTKRLLIKIYYQLDYNELLHSFINTFRVFISRKKLPEEKKEQNQLFLNFLSKLIKLQPHQQKEFKALLLKIEAIPDVAEQKWLIDETRKKLKS